MFNKSVATWWGQFLEPLHKSLIIDTLDDDEKYVDVPFGWGYENLTARPDGVIYNLKTD